MIEATLVLLVLAVLAAAGAATVLVLTRGVYAGLTASAATLARLIPDAARARDNPAPNPEGFDETESDVDVMGAAPDGYQYQVQAADGNRYTVMVREGVEYWVAQNGTEYEVL